MGVTWGHGSVGVSGSHGITHGFHLGGLGKSLLEALRYITRCVCQKVKRDEMERMETHYNQMEETEWAELQQKSPQTYQNHPASRIIVPSR